MQIRSGFQQDTHDIRVSLGNGPHERGLVLRAFLCIRVGAVEKQRPYRGEIALAGGDHERCAAGVRRDVRVAARRQQFRDHGRVAGSGSDPERCDAQIVLRVHGRAGSDQQVRRIEVIQVGSPVQGGRAVALPRIRIGVMLARSVRTVVASPFLTA